MIVFAAITPHSPLLIPTIGKEHREQLSQTIAAFSTLRTACMDARPDALVILSPHGTVLERSFPIGMAPEYNAHFEHFGDFGARATFAGDVLLPTLVKQTLEMTLALTAVAEPMVDHGVAIPALELLQKDPLPICPIGMTLLDYAAHYHFGTLLAPLLTHSERRIAVIASAELSHRLGAIAPLGYSPHGATFDAHVLDMITRGTYHDIIDLDPALVQETGSCGIPPLALLFGILSSSRVTPNILAYEAPFGIGYATIELKL